MTFLAHLRHDLHLNASAGLKLHGTNATFHRFPQEHSHWIPGMTGSGLFCIGPDSVFVEGLELDFEFVTAAVEPVSESGEE